jgi:hypothetical protein
MSGIDTPVLFDSGTSTPSLVPFQRRAPGYNGSGSTISKGDWVAIDTSVTTHGMGTAIKKSPASADSPLVVGVAAADIVNGAIGDYIWRGPTDADTNVASAIGAGVSIQPSATAGRAAAAGADTERRIGFTLTDPASNAGRVFVTC